MERHNTIIQMYKEGIPKYKIASRIHCSKHTIEKELEIALRNGEIPSLLKGRRSDCKKGGKPKNILPTEVRYATVCDLYRKGYTLSEIQDETGMCFETVSKFVERGRYEDNLWDKNSKERLDAVKKRREEKGFERKKPEMVYHTVPSTLQPGQTVRCTGYISDRCVYGRRNASEPKCRYSLVTGKCRTVGKNREFVNPSWACTCFSKVSKSNPKINNAEVE